MSAVGVGTRTWPSGGGPRAGRHSEDPVPDLDRARRSAPGVHVDRAPRTTSPQAPRRRGRNTSPTSSSSPPPPRWAASSSATTAPSSTVRSSASRSTSTSATACSPRSSPSRCSAARSARPRPAGSPTGIGRIRCMQISAVLFTVSAVGSALPFALWDLTVWRVIGGFAHRHGLGHRPGLHRRGLAARLPRPARLVPAGGDRASASPSRSWSTTASCKAADGDQRGDLGGLEAWQWMLGVMVAARRAVRAAVAAPSRSRRATCCRPARTRPRARC